MVEVRERLVPPLEATEKVSFVEFYVRSVPPKITTHFNEELFLRDAAIHLAFLCMPLEGLLKIFTPWHAKGGVVGKTIEEILQDPDYRPIAVGDVMRFPDKAEKVRERRKSLPPKLWPIPVAYDTALAKCLLLDSNRTVTALLQNPANRMREVEVAMIQGGNLSRLVIDFSIISREVSRT